MTVKWLNPSECTWGEFWFGSEIVDDAPFLCNNTDALAGYYATWDNFTVSGTVSAACTTAMGFTGKPCDSIHP